MEHEKKLKRIINIVRRELTYNNAYSHKFRLFMINKEEICPKNIYILKKCYKTIKNHDNELKKSDSLTYTKKIKYKRQKKCDEMIKHLLG